MRIRWTLGGLGLILVGLLLALPMGAKATESVTFCLSCHEMLSQGESIAISVHRDAATCSDCHSGSLVQKYIDGARHLSGHLTGNYEHPIVLREGSRTVASGQCAECHRATSLHARTREERGRNCLDCHRGHHERPYILPGVN